MGTKICELLRVSREKPSKEALLRATSVLNSGGVVVMPTETVYGLVGDVSKKEALGRIFELKRRPAHKPISIFVNNEILRELFPQGMPELAQSLARKFWPGPLTLIVPYNAREYRHLTSGSAKLGLRCSSCGLIRETLRMVRKPLSATSANLSGEDRPYPFQRILATFGSGVDLILKGEERVTRKPSTVVEVETEGLRIIREGAVPRGKIESMLF